MSGNGKPEAWVTLAEADYPQVKALGERLGVDLAAFCQTAEKAAEADGAAPLVVLYGSLSGLAGTLAVTATRIARLERDEAISQDTERLAHFHSCILGYVLDLLKRDLPWPEGKGGQA